MLSFGPWNSPRRLLDVTCVKEVAERRCHPLDVDALPDALWVVGLALKELADVRRGKFEHPVEEVGFSGVAPAHAQKSAAGRRAPG